MNSLASFLTRSPVAARVAPFLVFLFLTVCQEYSGEGGAYWFYLAKTLVGAWLLWLVRSALPEMRWQMSWEAVVTGVIVFALWVGLDPIVPNQRELWTKLGAGEALAQETTQWNPFRHFGERSTAGWVFFALRLLCSSLIVSPMEEIFYRSFLYRWLQRHDFQTVPLGEFASRPFIATALIFGFAHNEWLAGILCGVAYQALVCRKKRLGDAITAHTITNFLLGLWVVSKNAWHFW